MCKVQSQTRQRERPFRLLMHQPSSCSLLSANQDAIQSLVIIPPHPATRLMELKASGLSLWQKFGQEASAGSHHSSRRCWKSLARESRAHHKLIFIPLREGKPPCICHLNQIAQCPRHFPVDLFCATPSPQCCSG